MLPPKGGGLLLVEPTLRERWAYAWEHKRVSLWRQVRSGFLAAVLVFVAFRTIWNDEAAMQEIAAILAAVIALEILTPVTDFFWDFVRAGDKRQIAHLTKALESGQMPSRVTISEENLARELAKWAYEAGWDVLHSDANPDATVDMVIVDKEGNRTVVTKRRNNVQLAIAHQTILPKKVRDSLITNPQKHQHCVREMQTEMLKMAINYKNIGMPLKTFRLDKQHTVEEGLDKQSFLDWVNEMRRASRLLHVIIGEAAGV